MKLKQFLTLIIILFCLFFPVASLAEISIFFSPDGGIQKEIIAQINQAQDYIDIAIYSFTSESIAEALIKAKNRGVKIRVLMDKLQAAGQYSQYQFCLENGVRVIKDIHSGIMHNKIAIIDGKILLIGSYNWTKSAEEINEENFLKFIDETEIIDIYQARLNYLWGFNDPFWEDSE